MGRFGADQGKLYAALEKWVLALRPGHGARPSDFDALGIDTFDPVANQVIMIFGAPSLQYNPPPAPPHFGFRLQTLGGTALSTREADGSAQAGHIPVYSPGGGQRSEILRIRMFQYDSGGETFAALDFQLRAHGVENAFWDSTHVILVFGVSHEVVYIEPPDGVNKRWIASSQSRRAYPIGLLSALPDPLYQLGEGVLVVLHRPGGGKAEPALVHAIPDQVLPDPIVAMNGFKDELAADQDLLIYGFERWDELTTSWRIQYQTRNLDLHIERLDVLAEILEAQFGLKTEGEVRTVRDEALGEVHISDLTVLI